MDLWVIKSGSRDMHLTRSRDGVAFSKPEKLSTGTWQLNACPMDGGGIVVADYRIVTVWRREHSIYLASPGAQEVASGMERMSRSRRHPGGVFAIWSTAGVRVLAPGKKQSVAIAPTGALPAIVALSGGGALAAWEDAGKIQIRALP